MAEVLREIAAEFFAREAPRTALITVTRADSSPDLKQATIFFTVMPAEREGEVLAWTKKVRSDFRDVLKEKMATKNIPFIDFAIDQGEKNRQKIDELLQ